MSKPDIYTILSTELSCPVYMQGSLAEDAPYPDLFVTYYWSDTEDKDYFDNAPSRSSWLLQICIYGISPSALDELRERVLSLLKDFGFWRESKGRAIPSGEVSHLGWVIDFYISEEA